MLQELAAHLDRQDAIILAGLLLLSTGLALVAVPLGLIVSGTLIFLLGVGAFVPRGKN